jgi:hypothetical protein
MALAMGAFRVESVYAAWLEAIVIGYSAKDGLQRRQT